MAKSTKTPIQGVPGIRSTSTSKPVTNKKEELFPSTGDAFMDTYINARMNGSDAQSAGEAAYSATHDSGRYLDPGISSRVSEGLENGSIVEQNGRYYQTPAEAYAERVKATQAQNSSELLRNGQWKSTGKTVQELEEAAKATNTAAQKIADGKYSSDRSVLGNLTGAWLQTREGQNLQALSGLAEWFQNKFGGTKLFQSMENRAQERLKSDQPMSIMGVSTGIRPSSLPEEQQNTVSQFMAKTPEQRVQQAREIANTTARSGQLWTEKTTEGMGTVGKNLSEAYQSALDVGADAIDRAFGAGGGMAALVTRSFGSAYSAAEQNGMDSGNAVKSGLANAAVEYFTEMIGGPFETLYGKTLLGKATNRVISRMSKTTAQRIGMKILSGAAGEAAEEIVGGLLEPIVSHLLSLETTSDENGNIYVGNEDWSDDPLGNYWNSVDKEGALHSAFIASLVGGLGGGVDIARGAATRFTGDSGALVQAAKDSGDTYEAIPRYEERVNSGKALSNWQAENLLSNKSTAEAYAERLKRDAEEAARAELERQTEAAKDQQSEEYLRRNGVENIAADAKADTANVTFDRDGQQARFDGLTMEDGSLKAKVTDAENNTENVKLDEVIDSLPENVRDLVESVQTLGENAAGAYSLYDSEQSIARYAAAMDQAINLYAANGVSMDKAGKETMVGYLTDAQRTFAESAGKKLFEAKQNRPVTSVQTGGRVSFGGEKLFGGMQQTTEEQARKLWGNDADDIISLSGSLSKAIGRDIVYFDSKQSDGTLWSKQGAYVANNGTVYVDIRAGRSASDTGQIIISKTLSHELTHSFKDSAKKEYGKLKTFISNHFASWNGGRSFEDAVMDRIRKAEESGGSMSYEEAVDEVIADACEDMIQNSEKVQQIVEEDRTLAEKIRDFVKGFLNKLKATIKGTNTESRLLESDAEVFEQALKLWDDALKASVENANGTGETRMLGEGSGNEAGEAIRQDGYQVVEGYSREEMIRRANEAAQSMTPEQTDLAVQEGRTIPPDAETEFSTRKDEEYMEKALYYADSTGFLYVSRQALEEAQKARQLIKAKLTDPKLLNKLNLPEDVEGNTFIADSSYGGTEENTTVCIRSLAAQALMDEVAKDLGRPLTVEDTLLISQEIMNYTDKPECIYCYVATDRRAYREFLGSYMMQRDSVIANLQNGMERDQAYKIFLDGRKPTDNMRNRFNLWADAYEKGQELITSQDLSSLEDLFSETNGYERQGSLTAEEKLRYQQLKDAMAYAQSASWAKKMKAYTAYNNHILKWSKKKVADFNRHYGLRMYSFSDYSPAFVLENMQMVTDASVKGLKMLAYTKELDFARIFAPTGMNINISIFASEVNGQITPDGMMGADWTEARKLREQYPNVGLTLVATNDNILRYGMEQDFIDVVIPYHLVRTGKKVADYFGYKNYTSVSADGKGVDFKGGKQTSVYPSEHQNDLIRYVERLQELGLTPRFAEYLNGYEDYINEQISEQQFREMNPNYMKLVNETRRSAAATPIVQPRFNTDEALRSIDDMAKQGGYYQPIGGSVENQNDIAEEIAGKIREKSVQYSFRDAGETANMKLVPYSEEEKMQILSTGGVIIDSYEKIQQAVEKAFSDKSSKGRIFFGKISKDTMLKISKNIKDLPKEFIGQLFKNDVEYNLEANYDDIRHLVDEKQGMNKDDVSEYLDKLPDTVTDADSITFQYYDHAGTRRPAILFEKSFSDGSYVSLETISNKKNRLLLQTMYMRKNDYQKKKSSTPVLMNESSAYTSETIGSTTSSADNIPQNAEESNGQFSTRNSNQMAETAEEHFGITNNANVAGYIDINGNYLDFSGKHWGGKSVNERQVDHADVSEILPDDFDTFAVTHDGKINRSGSMAMYEFLKYGNIRTQPETGSIEMTMMPTDEQFGKIRQFVKSMRAKGFDQFKISLNDLNTDGRIYPVQTLTYDRKASADQMILDIQDYYSNGTLPEGMKEYSKNIQNSWMWSERTDGRSNREVLADALDNAAQTDAEKRILKNYRKNLETFNEMEKELDAERQVLRELNKQNPFGEEAKAQREKVDRLADSLTKADKSLLRLEAAEPLQNVLNREKERVGKARERRVKDYYQQKIREDRLKREESANIRIQKKRVTDKANALYELLVTNSDKKHVPEVLKAPLSEFLASINFDSKRKLAGGPETKTDINFGAKIQKMQQVLNAQQRYLNGEDTGSGDIASQLNGYLDIPQDSIDYLADMASKVTEAMDTGKQFTINEMSAEELKGLSNLLSSMKSAITNMNNFMANARYTSVREAADQDIARMERLGRTADRENSGLRKLLKWKNATPFYAMKRFGAGGESIFDGLTKGWEKMAKNVEEIIDFTKSLYTTEEVNQWKNDVHNITLESGDDIRITTAQIMELSQLLNREQAIKHMEKGGVRIGNIENGSGRKGQIVDTTHYHLSQEDIEGMLSLLTDRQMQVATELRKYMGVHGGDLGNEVSRARHGYDFYTEGSTYYPIRTDANDRAMADTDAQQNSMFRLLNLSSSKSLNPRASNALIVGDIFDTFADHMSDMAKYNGMGLPILDAIKWFNYKERINNEDGTYDTRTLQSAMERAFGEEAQRYFKTLIKDINGVHEGGDRGGEPAGKLTSNYKVAAVAANMRVAFLQPTSYVRASFMIKPKYLAEAFTRKNGYNEAMKYSGTAVWKSLGFYDTNIARNMRDQIEHNDSWKDRLVEASMKGAELGDSRTWGRMWVACKLQTQAENPGLSGDALNEKTADLFRNVIYSSQVMDSTLTRSELMRSSSRYDKALTAFMAEPTLSYNIVMDALSAYELDVREHGKQGAAQRNAKNLQKAVSVYAASATFSAIVESIIDAIRDDDDEEFWEKFRQAFLGEGDNAIKRFYDGNLGSDLSLLAKLPYAKTAISIIQGFGPGDMSAEGIESLVNAIKVWAEAVKLSVGSLDKATETTYYGKMTTWGKIYKTIQPLSQLSGLPASAALRDLFAVWNTVMNTVNPDMKIRTYDRSKLSGSKEQAYKEFVKDTGLSQKKYQGILKQADLDGNGSLKQDEIGEYLYGELESGNLSAEQADSVWNAQGWKTGYYEWAEKVKSQENKKAGTYKAFINDHPEIDSDGNGRIKQDELGTILQQMERRGELSASEAANIWSGEGSWKKTYDEWKKKK